MLATVTAAGSNIDLIPLLYEPAQFEAKLPDGPSTSAPASQAPSILDALHSLNQQCHVFKKSAEQLGGLLLPAATNALSFYFLMFASSTHSKTSGLPALMYKLLKLMPCPYGDRL